MSGITSNPNKRTSNGLFGLPLVATNTGSRWTRAVGYSENALYKVSTEVLRAPISIAKGGQAVGQIITDASKAVWKFANTDPSQKTTTPTNLDGLKNKNNKDIYRANGGAQATATNAARAQKTPTAIPIQSDPDSTYKWNLPPHEWSLPLDPGRVYDSVSAPSNGDESELHTNRRGRIFVGRKYVSPTVSSDPKTGRKIKDAHSNNNYGFQFLWNPETFTQSTSVNWGITPSQTDITSILTGLTNANSSISLTLRLDRTNDFAAARGLNAQVNNPSSDISFYTNLRELAKYYKKGQAPQSELDFSTNMETKITELLRRGTLADLEYLYRTINGDNYKSSWGTNTSNISFLLPTIIRLDIGPQRLVGMVQNLNVTHLAFTREMVPIRTDVELTIDLRSSAGLTTNNFGASQAEADSVFNPSRTPTS